MHVYSGGRLLDGRPEIACDVVEEKCSNLAEIKAEMQVIVYSVQASRQPFPNFTRYTGPDEGPDEIRLGCKITRQRLDDVQYGKRATRGASGSARARWAVDR